MGGLGAVNRPDGISAGGTVLGNMDAWRDIAAPPPAGADRTAVVLCESGGPVLIENIVSVAAQVLDVVTVEYADEGVQVCVLSVQRFVPAEAGRPCKRLVGRDEDGRALVHVREVFTQPLQLFGGEILGVIAAVFFARLHPGEVHVVHHNVVDLAKVEGIVVRRQILCIFEGFKIVACNFHLVVVVTHGVEERDAGEVSVHGLEIIGKAIVVGNPVHVPCHVAKGEAIYLSGGFGNGLVNECSHFFELGKVAGAACQVHVAKDEEGIVVIGSLHKFEVHLLFSFGIGLEGFPEFGKDAVEGCFIAAGNGYEHIFPFLVGLQTVVAVGIGLYNLDTVGNQHVGNAGTLAGYLAGDICGRRDAFLFNGYGLAAGFVGEDYLAAPGRFIVICLYIELKYIVDETLGGDVGNPALGVRCDCGAYVGIRFGRYRYHAALGAHGNC